jgi:hypothetical protein
VNFASAAGDAVWHAIEPILSVRPWCSRGTETG